MVVATSVSGDTEETLTILDSSRKIGAKLVAFSSGGKMQEYCIKNQIDHRNISQLHSPRESLTAFLYSVLHVLGPALQIEKKDVLESVGQLENLKKKISSSDLSKRNPTVGLAKLTWY